MSETVRSVMQKEQRGRLGRIRWARVLMAENGARWTAYAALLAGLKNGARRIEGRMARLEARNGLSGRTGRGANYQYWQRWDWSHQGEEWTPSDDWKRSLIDDVMLWYLKPNTTIVEIGPGAGRWTEALQGIASRLILVDLSDRCIELCRRRFAQAGNIEYHVNDGRSLSAIESDSVDGVWSFDVFVHIAPPDVESYIAEISRVLRPGGRAVINHAKGGRDDGASDIGQRSNMSAADFARMIDSHGLTLVEQFDAWGPGGRHKVTTKWDTVSVIEK
ncbi:MAG: class I SAM-dependent methyltransferase [Chloroflexi bacterium]|nr:MAG: class I SAM-dependent methyltransferase [Chloroflexota bacterium]TMC72966.1 MAG: class I SAM-dependent methyltransferase [Chloroflexota bacterium]